MIFIQLKTYFNKTSKTFGVIFGFVKIIMPFSFLTQLLDNAAEKYGERETRIAECTLNV